MRRFILFIVTFLMMGCSICHRVQYVPVATKTDSVIIEKIVERVDSVEVPVKYVPDYYKWINIIFWCIVVTGLIFVIVRLRKFFHITLNCCP